MYTTKLPACVADYYLKVLRAYVDLLPLSYYLLVVKIWSIDSRSSEELSRNYKYRSSLRSQFRTFRTGTIYLPSSM